MSATCRAAFPGPSVQWDSFQWPMFSILFGKVPSLIVQQFSYWKAVSLTSMKPVPVFFTCWTDAWHCAGHKSIFNKCVFEEYRRGRSSHTCSGWHISELSGCPLKALMYQNNRFTVTLWHAGPRPRLPSMKNLWTQLLSCTQSWLPTPPGTTWPTENISRDWLR